jgi:dCTP deaminase
VLSDTSILQALREGLIFKKGVSLTESQIQPASIDLTLGEDVHLTPARPFVLSHLAETFSLSPTLAARVEGKSTWARRGVQVHSAGFIDPGFCGQVTLEIVLLDPLKSIIIPRGTRVAQVCFFKVDGVVRRPYGTPSLYSHYQGQEGTTPARNGYRIDDPATWDESHGEGE